MAKFDYCQSILLNHSCEDYLYDNCDNCNMYKAYMKGVEDCAAGIKEALTLARKRKEQEHE